MAYAYFQNQGAFDTYHNKVCADMGIPKPGYNMASDEPGVMDAWTNAWVDPIQLKDQGNVTTWTAHIPDSHITIYDPELGIIVYDSQVTFSADGKTVTITGVGPQPKTFNIENLSFNHRKGKPATWTDPKTGIVYDTTTGQPVP